MLEKDDKIFVAGHRGLAGSAILRRLETEGFGRILTRTRAELDLTVQAQVENFFAAEKPEIVFLAAGKVGGIWANNSQPADFIRDNLLIQTNVIDAAHRHGVKKFIFLGSSCIYPKHAPQPLKEEYLLTSALEPTNEAYAIAKIAGIKMCQAYRRQYGFGSICLMPTNLYGTNDNFDLANSHVLPALLRKFHEAKTNGYETVKIWGTGTPQREFLHADDLADACHFLMRQPSETLNAAAPDGIINVGVGEDVSILQLAEIISRTVEFRGSLEFDSTKPDGTPRKLLDVCRLAGLGWKAKISLSEGIAQTYRWYKEAFGRDNRESEQESNQINSHHEQNRIGVY
ncbi:MAG TPA: GDP-L-fucose synthase [Pyrinomonadaceae bacterium]|jgi:GDP-L-fucose synthase